MTPQELHDKVMRLVEKTDFSELDEHLSLVGHGQRQEIENTTGRPNQYYQWLHCAMKVLKPKQVMELGAAAGISTIMMTTALPEESKLISVDIDPTIAWKWMNRDYPQVVKVLGDDLDLSMYPNDVDFGKTDFWFIDSLHTPEQLQAEIDLYGHYWGKGTVLAFDDIHIDELDEVWDALPYNKLDITDPCHYSGWGIAVV